MAQQIAGDGGSADNHPAADLETIVVDPEDVLEMFRRNNRDATEQRSHVLRVTPPLKGEQKASLYVSDDHAYYPADVDPAPIHIGAATLFEGRPDNQLDPALAHPDYDVQRSQFRDEFEHWQNDDSIEEGEDMEGEWDEWWNTAVEVWESNVRNAMQEPREIELGATFPESPTTTVTVRFEADE
ncbi:hypothetical protein [Natrinema pallidum]|uniref:DUF8009 domain-containing protein n=1 Tax=Natrinema pallidum TaxID=69527 RepID=A0A4P9TK25_9EURY|nr:hypothetical protein [Natrinema pallidum]QCW05283.1 hypothetical protein FGF80_18750 [Natrinema pallidum]